MFNFKLNNKNNKTLSENKFILRKYTINRKIN